ncbi:hypothetical protein BDN67DRAFT_976313 [Paxillus ammoniavirescens]|nr:hypothetical protein BDN67DRAFT_976313 [Paxillus ammoniavirescens]
MGVTIDYRASVCSFSSASLDVAPALENDLGNHIGIRFASCRGKSLLSIKYRSMSPSGSPFTPPTLLLEVILPTLSDSTSHATASQNLYAERIAATPKRTTSERVLSHTLPLTRQIVGLGRNILGAAVQRSHVSGTAGTSSFKASPSHLADCRD